MIWSIEEEGLKHYLYICKLMLSVINSRQMIF